MPSRRRLATYSWAPSTLRPLVAQGEGLAALVQLPPGLVLVALVPGQVERIGRLEQRQVAQLGQGGVVLNSLSKHSPEVT